MVKFLSAVLALVSAVAVSAAAIPGDAVEVIRSAEVEVVDKRATCAYTCGTICYYSTTVTAAKNKGHQLRTSGSTINGYPHQYNNYEGFSFPTSAPWYEFPIMNTFTVYTGGSPGPDRVIFDASGNLDSVITHTGASGNNFVACKKG
ncbi:Ribonuclease/ribotoxin [Podospora didyma]|uniref:ribonuclease T1 n=1 Tax=Podospora didyma TaxID=330526 RepID=A0AAE0N5R6_9PEZI|nr:Ribonuclease/ribotoxin [Podospora didyma]